jgi:C-type lysozyme/alpha-lactalbumin family
MKNAQRMVGMIALAVLLGATACSSGGDASLDGEQGSTAETREEPLLAGREVPEEELRGLLADAGFSDDVIPKLVCTAKWESTFFERAQNKNGNGTTDRGLFQINSVHIGGTPGCPATAEELFDAAANTTCAHAIYEMQGIRAWYGYRAHKRECDAAR